MNRHRGHAFCYRMHIILMAPVRLLILKSSTNQLTYHYACSEYWYDAHAKDGMRFAFAVKRTFPSFTASTMIRVSIIPSIHSAIISFACAKFFPHETVPCTAGAVTTYPPMSRSGSNTQRNVPYFVFIATVFFATFFMPVMIPQRANSTTRFSLII